MTYTKSKVPVLGCLSGTVQHANTTVPATFYVVKTATALLGLDLFRALRLSFEHNAVLPDAASPLAANSPAVPAAEIKAGSLTEELGLAKGFIHKVKVREGAQPIQEKLRRLPVSFRQAVTAEIERLLKMDVIERIDASPWLSPIVVTLRKNGKAGLVLVVKHGHVCAGKH